VTLPDGGEQVVPGSSWGTFTIACTIPIALLMGFYTYRVRRGRIVEASLFGGAAVLAAVVAGNWVPGSALEAVFSLTKGQTVLALTVYGFIAAVLPVWLLLVPRDYLSSFLKIGTIAVLIGAVLLANPALKAPPINEVAVEARRIAPSTEATAHARKPCAVSRKRTSVGCTPIHRLRSRPAR